MHQPFLFKIKPDYVAAARPFVGWMGAKGKLLHALLPLIPSEFTHYHEPFVGGGSVFFAQRKRPGQPRRRRYSISDFNRPLVTTYQVVKNQVDALVTRVTELKRHEADEAYFYWLRDEHQPETAVDVAARFYYMNKTGYNKGYEVTMAGRETLTFGKGSRWIEADYEAKLRHASHALRGVDIRHCSFEAMKRASQRQLRLP